MFGEPAKIILQSRRTRYNIRAMNLPVLNKPTFGAPCNGCGYCCAVELCELAEEHFAGAVAPCPALEYRDGRFLCGLVLRPSHHLKMHFTGGDKILTPLFLQAIGAGQGCGCPDSEVAHD